MNDTCSGFLCETQWLEDNLTRADLRIIECTYFLDFNKSGQALLASGRDAWQASHIPNSRFIDLLTELSDPNTHLPFMMPSSVQFSQVMSRNGIDDSTPVVIYDREGTSWATRLWWMLRANGFDRAAILNGGWHKWRLENRPVSIGPSAQPATAIFSARPSPHLFVDKRTVLHSIQKDGIKMICALGQEPYLKGHIPGSLNVPAVRLLDPISKAFLPLDQLARLFEQAGVSKQDRIITYCGGGIASTCDAFILTMLGYDTVAVYDGSMEEWKRDSGLPLEVVIGLS